MPRLLSRGDALEKLRTERGGDCLICALRDGALGPSHVLARGPRTTALLSRYPVRWGHALVLLDRHLTRFCDVDEETWQEASIMALRAAQVLERELAPDRCYIASLGSPTPGLLCTSPHLHLHVIPLHDPNARPASVLTWEHGVLAADEPEWQALHAALRARWASVYGPAG